MHRSKSTITTKGVIDHQLHLPTGILAPVMITLPKGPKNLPEPVQKNGKYLYALPGGRSFAG